MLRRFFGDELRNLLNRQVAVPEIGPLIIDGSQLECETQRFGHSILQRAQLFFRIVEDFSSSSARCSVRHAFEQDQVLSVQHFLQARVVIAFADVRNAGEPNNGLRSVAGNELADCDLQFRDIRARPGNAQKR